ncbi:SPOC like C-terminal domain-containing protein [Lasiosphaeria miniovina]|uniref:ATP-dependent DNA helicase II subunit 2 n=1 Tax=Lasiosphaeria miniovina TaxID=1954250 RepID=A0AA40E3Q1_9PEZI|nr:SPOC like C-terminal domain-containing protein [Lasiosphaeria miniovina]KAK0722931.1 SPOC like C-terminal domain-containing protein [Lasiosphaeria miniovina]
MADKEAIVYVIDLGESMGDCHGGRTETDLDWSMRYVWDRISTTVAAGRKTWTAGVVALNTDDTNNEQDREGLDGYENISVLQNISPLTMNSVRELQPKIRPSSSSGGDAISAVVVALSMIEQYTKKLKYNRRIILITNAEAPIDDESSEEVARRLDESDIELIVLGVDFDDAEYGFKEEDKSSAKANNERILGNLASQCKNGVSGTMAQAIEELSIPRIKQVNPFKAYDGALTLGDPATQESALSIRVQRYFKTKRATAPSASTVVIKSERGGGPSQSTHTADEDVEMGGIEFSGVKHMRTYRVNDPDAPGGKKDVEFEKLAKGYQYGSTVVPFSESEMNIIKLPSKKGYEILGFVPFSSYGPFVNMGETGIVVAQSHSEEAEVTLSALIHALHEMESYAVARYVQKDDAHPQLFLLKPNPGLEDPFECLYDVPLPFAEDVRSYQFPPLDKVLTVTGQVLTEHRLLPSDDLNVAMSNYVDAMDLSEFGADDEGKPAEYAPIDELYNPVLHRVNQAIKARAVHPDEPLAPPADILLRFQYPPEKLVKEAKFEIESLIEAAEVKPVPEKAQGKRFKKDTVKPLSGLDIDSLLGQKRRTTISPENAIPEFKQLVASAADDATLENAIKQIGGIVRELVRESFADLSYGRAAEDLRVMRETCVDLELPALYNKFLTALKTSILSGELDGDRRQMWTEHIVGRGLGLIARDESEVSDVAVAEALKASYSFLSWR